MLFFFFLLALALLAHAQSPIQLGDLPLAVKTPYLHSWVLNNDQKAPQRVWPSLFTLAKTLGWNGMIRVDGQSYQWMGNSNISDFADTVATQVTPTRTIFTIHAGLVKFNATFFSPIEPNDYTRQSVPFVYLYVDGFTADDAKPHTIQLYSDISAEWVSHDELTQVIWNTQDSSNMVYHHVQPTFPQSMVDNADSAEDATAYYGTSKRSGLTWQTGADADCRTTFALSGNLGNTRDVEFRMVKDRWPVFSFAIDLGSIKPTDNQSDPVVWTLGLVRDPLVNYATSSGSQLRTGYYWSAYRNISVVISDFLGDFTSARDRGQTFDDTVLNAGLAISPKYAGILSLVTRQIFASMDITIPASSNGGQPNASDVKIFMKDVSMSTRANPVEVIYAAFPALIYFNSSFGHDLLLPLLEFQSSPNYPNHYAAPDLGTRYPTITGNPGANEELAIEHCGNMLIMTYAHAAKSGDNSLISGYYSLLRTWAEYLVNNSLHPTNARSADFISYPDMSNLALKGILGVYSMGKIDEVLNTSNTTFKDKAKELFENWKQLAVADDHIQAEYGKPDTWGLMYNLFPAVWLQARLIDDDILNREALYYLSNTPPGDQSYSLDNVEASNIAYPHWSLMTAAMLPSGFTSVRDTLISSSYIQAYDVSRKFPLPIRYTASTGVQLNGTVGSAAQGAAYGILALGIKNANDIPPDTGDSGSNPKDQKTPAGAIVGGVIGGLAFLLIVAGSIVFWRWRKMQRPEFIIEPLYGEGHPGQHPFNAGDTPNNPNNASISPKWKPSPHTNLVPNLVASSQNESSERHSGLPDVERLYNISRRDDLSPVVNATSPITPTQTSLSEGRGASRHSQPHQTSSESSRRALRIARSTTGQEGRETWRVEVEELRREMEAIRDMAQPPPSYR